MKSINENLLYKYIGKRIHDIRRSNNTDSKITQAELAHSVGVTRTTITNIEKGNQGISIHLIYEVCAQLGVRIHDILPSLEEFMELEQMIDSLSISETLDMQFREDKRVLVEEQVKNFLTKRIK